MALPKIEHPLFQIKLKSTGETIQFRPFTVKEEKILLVAEMSKEVDDIVLAVKQILSNCIVTEGIDVNTLAIFDLEYIFVQLRSKSVGNIIQFVVIDAEDQKQIDVEVDLDDVEVVIPEDHVNIFKIDETTFMKMKYPTVNDLDMLIKFNKTDPEQSTKMIARFIDSVYDEDKVYDLKEESESSICTWLDSFDRSAMAQVTLFWKTMPTLQHVVNYKNSLGHDRSIMLNGLTDFFQ